MARVRIPKSRRGRRAGSAASVAVVAIAAAAVAVPSAFAESEHPGSSPARILEVDQALLGLVEIGETVELAESLTGADEDRVLEVSDPGASYVKVHFDRLLLAGGDYVTVSSPDGEESYRYDESTVREWAMSITGDTAVVELHRESGGAPAAMGAVIDKVAYGFPAEVVDELAAARASGARTPESICETDDKRPSPCYEESHPDVVDRTDPVARLLIDGRILCTAFRVGERNRMLTNNHCFSRSWEARRTEAWFGYDCLSCSGEGATDPVKVAGQRVLATSRSLDYTLFSVADFEAVERFGHLELDWERPARGQAIYIPQHPSGRPTEIALKSSADGGNCMVRHAVYDGYAAGSDVAYLCDTEFGSSGSPVLSRDTHRVVALHHFGGCPNSGVAAQLIRSEIKALL